MNQSLFEEKSLKENAGDLKVLYVDEHAGTRLKLSKILKKYFLQIDILSNAHDTMKHFQKKYYDLIVVGTIEDGSINICQEIKHIAYKKPIIMVSNIKDPVTLIKYINSGLSGYISVPLENGDVISVLSKTVREISDFNILYCETQSNMTQENILDIEQKIQETQEVQKEEKLQTLEEQYIEFPSISALEFNETYPTDLESTGDQLLEITEVINLAINRFVNSPSQENAIPVIYSFHQFSNILNAISEFSNISISTQKLADIFTSLDYSKSYKEYYDVILVISIGLIKWCDSVFVNRDTNNIHYLDKSLLADAMMIESLFLGTENENIEGEIEFF